MADSGPSVLEYDGDRGEEFAFTLEDGPDGYYLIEDSSGLNSRIRTLLAAGSGPVHGKLSSMKKAIGIRLGLPEDKRTRAKFWS